MIVQDTQPTDDQSPIEIARHIAQALGEEKWTAIHHIKMVVQALGVPQSLQLLKQTQQVEANGGLLITSGKRRRTPGGVFFVLAKQQCNETQQAELFPERSWATVKQKGAEKKAAAPNPPKNQQPPIRQVEKVKKVEKAEPSFNWEERIAILTPLAKAQGRISTVKITLMGRIDSYNDAGSCAVAIMRDSGEKPPSLPKGVPVPPATKTSYSVYVGLKQWKSVVGAASDPEDAFIVEGYPQIDTKTGSIAVFATSITTKKQQRAKFAAKPGN